MYVYFQREISEQNQIFDLQQLRWLNANVSGFPSFSPPYSFALPSLPFNEIALCPRTLMGFYLLPGGNS
jgi:hypothetical protein